MRPAVLLAEALAVCCSSRVAVTAPGRTLPPTDDPPQPRCPAWVDGLMPPPAAIDPRQLKALPSIVQQNSTNASSDDGIAPGTTPSVFVFGDSMYTMGVAVQQATAMVFAAEYNSFNLHSFNASGKLAFGRRRAVYPKSEFYGFGGIFAVLAKDDGRSLYLAYDGNGCMSGNPASLGAPCAFVRHVELGPAGAERVAVRNLTTPRQMALDSQGRLYISEEWPEQIVRWNPRTGEQTVVLRNSEYAASGPLEGLAISSTGDLYFSCYGQFGNQISIATGSVSGVPLKSGAVWVKRGGATSSGGGGAIELMARGFWRTRGLALDEARGYLYVANEANAWDQGTSGCLSQIDLASGSVKKVAVGLDYPQFPSIELTTGRVFVPLALHNKLVAWDPRPASAFTPATGLDVFAARGISASVNGARLSAPDASKPQLRLTIDELEAPSTLTVGVDGATGEVGAGRRDAGGISIWIRIPAQLLTLYKLELPYNDAFHVRLH
eukprot:COSAG02_NODE_8131_length_2695_cov_20.340909_1_plen_494_part_00